MTLMYRKKGTSSRHSGPPSESAVNVTYREFAPTPELQGHVRAFFSFVPGSARSRGHRTVVREVPIMREDSFCSPLFADGHTSLVMDLGATCRLGQGWTYGAPVCARALGALRKVGGPAGNVRSAMLGAYLGPGSTATLLHVPAIELTDQVVNVEDIWGSAGAHLAEDLAALDEAARVDHLEEALLDRMRRAPVTRMSVDVAGLARWVRQEPARIAVRRLADAAGVSRQQLTRLFRQAVGVSPKRYCRLARFQAGLAYASGGTGVKWAQIAAELGYADQSHMIAEFREFSSLTPETLAREQWFHPFILDARSRFVSKPLR